MTDPTVPTPRLRWGSEKQALSLRDELTFLLDSTVDLAPPDYDRDTLLMRLECAFLARNEITERAARRQIEELRGALAKINATLDEVGILTVTDAQRLIYQIARAALASTPAPSPPGIADMGPPHPSRTVASANPPAAARTEVR